MAREVMMFDGQAATEGLWRKQSRLWAPTGVVSGLEVSIGSGSNVNLSAGSAWIDGFYYGETSTVAVPFTPNTLATPQLVRVVARVDPTANTITPRCITTAPQSSPTGVFDLLLAEFTLPPSGTAQTPTGLTDKRVMIPDVRARLEALEMRRGGLFNGSTDANGDVWIAHGLGVVPARINAVMRLAGVPATVRAFCGVVDASATQLRLRVYRTDTTPSSTLTSNPVALYWEVQA